jgi:hypothetical protein
VPLKLIDLPGEHYEWDPQTIDLTGAFAIKAASGLDLVPFQNGLNSMNPAALQALVWYLRQQNGRPEDIRHINFVISDLKVEDAPDPAGDENPTVTGSEPVETVTSDSSPTIATSPPETSTP